MTRDQAIEIAVKCADARLMPHVRCLSRPADWIVDAILLAAVWCEECAGSGRLQFGMATIQCTECDGKGRIGDVAAEPTAIALDSSHVAAARGHEFQGRTIVEWAEHAASLERVLKSLGYEVVP